MQFEKGEIDLINVPDMPSDTYRSSEAGSLHKYADVSLLSKEKAAFENAIVQKHI